MHSFVSLPKWAAWCGVAVWLGGAWASSAHAAGVCSNGTIGTSLLHPLPATIVIAMQEPVDNAPNPTLAQRFVSGLQSTGIAVSQQGNMTLSLAVSLAAPKPGGVSGKYKGFDWVVGMPRPGQEPRSVLGAKLSLSATLTDSRYSTQSWLMTIQCVVQTDDSGALAQDIGALIARNIGQHFTKKPI